MRDLVEKWYSDRTLGLENRVCALANFGVVYLRALAGEYEDMNVNEKFLDERVEEVRRSR